MFDVTVHYYEWNGDESSGYAPTLETYDELRWYTDVGRHHVTHTGPHTEYMLRKFDKLEALRKKNMHKYAAKAMTHYNPVFL